MEAIILTKDQYQDLVTRLDNINKHLKQNDAPSHEKYIDNQEFLLLLKISKRTAQTWRDEGKVSFSQVGGKIYYKLSDVEALMQQHYIKSYTRKH